jgi:aromatic ring-opening dioxygenase catalytic subunit (LigB family)
MEIIAAYACSHAGLLVTREAEAPSAQRDAIYAAFSTMGDAIRAQRPDAIVLVATDHGRIYPLTHVAQFTIGVSETAESLGDAQLPKRTVPIHQPFAQAILENIIAQGVDMAFSEQMQIDHSFVTPLMLAFGDEAIPVVPIAQNCNVPPLPTLTRSHEVGQKLRAAIEAGPPGRVVVIGTGGLSHWVGTPEQQAFRRQRAGTRIAGKGGPVTIDATGPINDAFDRAFLDALTRGTTMSFLRDWGDERLYTETGNGTHEIRNFVLVAGLVNDRPARVLAYEAVHEWLTGTAVVAFS